MMMMMMIGSMSHGTHVLILRSDGSVSLPNSGRFEDKIKITLWQTFSRPVCLRLKHSTGAQDQIFITVRQLRVCWCRARALSIFLTRRWVCRLQMLLALASAVIRGSESRRIMTIFCRLRSEALPTWRARSPYLYLPGTGWPNYISMHCVTFPSPPTTHRATVEVFERASTRGSGRLRLVVSIYNLGMDNIENAASKNASIIASCICWLGK
jgi:hypothetical protein